MIRYTAWLAHLDVPTVDKRVLVTQAELPLNGQPWPVLSPWPVSGPESRRAVVGLLQEVWIDDGWLRGTAHLNVAALPVGYRHGQIGAEIDVDAFLVQQSADELRIISWRLRAVTIGDRPSWPDARLEPVA